MSAVGDRAGTVHSVVSFFSVPVVVAGFLQLINAEQLRVADVSITIWFNIQVGKDLGY